MKKIRVVILIGIIILLSGCTGSYNLKINDDFSIEEKLNIIIDNSSDDTYEKTKKLFKDNNISKKKYKLSASDDSINIDYKEKYNSIEDYLLNNKIYKQLFDDLDYSYDNGVLKFNANSKMLLENINSDYLFNNYNISAFQINIETPFKIKKNNSDMENDNILTWALNKDTKSEEIYVEYDVEKSRSKIKDALVLSLIVIISLGTLVFLVIRFNNSKKI